MRSGCDGGKCRLLPIPCPWAQLTRVGDVWPSAHLSAATLASLPVDAIVVATDGTTGSLERVRTTLERDFPFQGRPVAIDALDPSTARLLAMIQDMTDVIIVAKPYHRRLQSGREHRRRFGRAKRPFSLLRLTAFPSAFFVGSSHSRVRCPLLIVAAVSIVVGLVAAALYLHSQVGIAFRNSRIAYWATVLGGLVHRSRDHCLHVPASQPDDRTRSRP